MAGVSGQSGQSGAAEWSSKGDGDGGGDVVVRPATRADMPQVHAMIQELADFEGVTDAVHLTAEDLVTDGFECSSPWFFGLVAERRGGGGGGALLGHALCSRAYSSWTRRAFYLEDLYVRAEARGRGVGRLLLRALCAAALREGVHRVDWHVLEANTRARAFYEQLGARDLRLSEGRAVMRLDRPRIERLAADADRS